MNQQKPFESAGRFFLLSVYRSRLNVFFLLLYFHLSECIWMYRLLNRHLIFDHSINVYHSNVKISQQHACFVIADRQWNALPRVNRSKEENIHSILCASIWNVTLDSWFVQSTNLSRFDCEMPFATIAISPQNRVSGMRLQVRPMHISIRHTMKFKRRNKNYCQHIVVLQSVNVTNWAHIQLVFHFFFFIWLIVGSLVLLLLELCIKGVTKCHDSVDFINSRAIT